MTVDLQIKYMSVGTRFSFDFDSTLEHLLVKIYAAELIKKGEEVWVTTSRFEEGHPPTYMMRGVWIEHDNSDLYKVTDDLGIPRDRIIFTNGKPKVPFIREKDFRWHLDDCWAEIKEINQHTNCKGILKFGNHWRKECQKYRLK